MLDPLRRHAFAFPRPALFLDRDGIVNLDTDFAYRTEDIVFQPGIFDLVRTARSAGFVPVIVTNQSGIARGYFSEAAFEDLTAWMLERFAAEEAAIARVYHCPFLPDAVLPRYRHPDHPWRKPRPGMFLAARDDLGLDLAASAMMGDRWSDALAASAAGLNRIALVGDRADREQVPAERPAVDHLSAVSEGRCWFERRVVGA